MNTKLIQETIELTLQGKITFPEVVGKLVNEGVDTYHVDYIRKENRYYFSNDDTLVEPVSHDFPKASQQFSAEKVKAAIQKVQKGEINYVEFSKLVLEAGCVYYIAYLKGRQVVYMGREGDSHTELFPKKTH